MNLTLLLILGLVPCALADDWEDFTNNLATDLAPLITLFGERLTKQFLSESISILDNIIFALSPLGVLTAVVSVIRICGSSSLRAFVGRAQEGPAEAEGELLPCVSESTAELFNDGGISRVFGRPRILEIIAWEEGPGVKVGTLREAIREGAWSVQGSNLRSEKTEEVISMPELDIPNLSLNKGIKQVDQFWFYATAILGALLQIGVLVYAALTVFVFPDSFTVDDNAVDSYAFPLYVIGTTFLFMGMFYCAVIIERSSKEYYITPNKPSKLYWLQPGEQTVGDQVFNSFLAVKEGEQSSMTYVKSKRVQKYDGRYVEVYTTILLTLLGFIFQFIGERGLHASVILAQLGSTFVMSVLRTCLRTERMKPEENKLREERELVSYKQQELDAFAFHLEGVKTFNLITSIPSDVSSHGSVNQSDGSLTQRVLQTRAKLAELTSKPDDDIWNDSPIRQVAQSLARTIETTMDVISSWGVEFKEPFEFPLEFEVNSSLAKWAVPDLGAWSIELTRGNDVLRWEIDSNELEAIIGLWAWSLYKSEQTWRKPLYRMVGLSEHEASQAETYLCFQKWIFRQTEARLASAKMVDVSRRLFGVNPDIYPSDRHILAVKTENNLETMMAQDIYIRFLSTAFSGINFLGGDTNVVPGLQSSWIAQNTRIEALVHCFESHHLGSREDALLCIIPYLKQRGILPDLAPDCLSVSQQIEELTNNNAWNSSFSLIRWISCRSTGPEFERSVLDLGYHCRQAMLDGNPSIREEGFKQVRALLIADPRVSFLEVRKNLGFSNWPNAPERVQWWHHFAKQLGWLSWQISKEVRGMQWTQNELTSLGVSENLDECTSLSGQDIELGTNATKTWLATNNVDVDRSFIETDDGIAFKWATQTNQRALIQWLLYRFKELSSELPDLEVIMWYWTAKYEAHWFFQVLRRTGANIDVLNPQGRSALAFSVEFRDIETARLLLANGANPDGSDEASNARPLLLAAHHGENDIVELLLEHSANMEVFDNWGLTALQYACYNNQLSTVRLLLSRGAEVDTAVGAGCSTPLIAAVSGVKFELTNLLLEYGPNLNMSDPQQYTPLMLAVKTGSTEMLRLLLRSGAGAHIRNSMGMNALDLAKEWNFVEAVEILESWMSL